MSRESLGRLRRLKLEWFELRGRPSPDRVTRDFCGRSGAAVVRKRFFLPYRAGRSARSILAEEVFERESARLQAYAERSGVPFVLLRIGLVTAGINVHGRNAAMELLARVVRNRVRLSDYVGWCEEKGRLLGVILCGTGLDGAASVFRDIEAVFREGVRRENVAGAHAAELLCDVSRYPAETESQAVNEGEMSNGREGF